MKGKDADKGRNSSEAHGKEKEEGNNKSRQQMFSVPKWHMGGRVAGMPRSPSG